MLAFARGLAGAPPILLLDEATSAIDPGAEARILAALDAARSGHTAVVLAHRLTMIRGADRILVLHHGELVEEGRHVDLVARAGVCACLVRLHRGTEAAA